MHLEFVEEKTGNHCQLNDWLKLLAVCNGSDAEIV